MAATSRRFLDRELPRHGIGLAWGAGRATEWFARRLTSLTIVESARPPCPRWLANVDLRLVAPDDEEAYVGIAGGLPMLDFVLVNGRAQRECVRAAVPRIKPGGLLAASGPAGDYVPENWLRAHNSKEMSVWRKPGATEAPIE